MGMFNSIYADIVCPDTGAISHSTEIQIKWQDYLVRCLTVYHCGDVLEEINPEYDNTWVRTDYICEACSPRTPLRYRGSRAGETFIRMEDQRRHIIFVRIEAGRVMEIIGEREFGARGLTEYVDYIWPPFISESGPPESAP